MQKKNKFKVVSVNKSRHILPSVLTLIGVGLGITSIKFAMDGNFTFAVLFLTEVDAFGIEAELFNCITKPLPKS